MTVLEAFGLAARLHAGQRDKAGRAYIGHLIRVFLRVLSAGGTEDQQIAALLHDSIEDGRISAEGLALAGVPEFAIQLVNALTRQEGEF